jgi:tetratricopeptide (TPR) repeat protein
MDKEDLLDRYEATLDEGTYLEARRLHEAALVKTADDTRLLFEYGYLQECHGRNALRAAISSYERAIELDPQWAKPRLQLIWASAALLQTDTAIALYKQRLAAAPGGHYGHPLQVVGEDPQPHPSPGTCKAPHPGASQSEPALEVADPGLDADPPVA